MTDDERQSVPTPKGGHRAKCEACYAVGDDRVGINLLNGHLYLCRPCLAEFNGKNPALAARDAEVAALKAENDLFRKVIEGNVEALVEGLKACRERDELRRIAGELAAALMRVRQLNPNQLPPEGAAALAAFAAHTKESPA